MDSWKRLQESANQDRVRLVYVSTENPEKTVVLAKERGLLEPVLLSTGETLAKYKVKAIPTTLVVGPGGVIRQVWVGTLSEDALRTLGGTSR
jgi:hypothetical protein